MKFTISLFVSGYDEPISTFCTNDSDFDYLIHKLNSSHTAFEDNYYSAGNELILELMNKINPTQAETTNNFINDSATDNDVYLDVRRSFYNDFKDNNISYVSLSFPSGYEGLTSIIIGTTVVDYKTMKVDLPPFPEHNSVNTIPVGGEGVVLSGEVNSDGNRYQSGVIESHYATSDWLFILKSYKNWLSEKNRNYTYIFVVLNGELVHHEINAEYLM